MSSTAMDWAWTRPVDGPRLLVLLALAKRVRPKTDQATPSMPELVYMTGLAETTVRAHLQALAEDGVITADVSTGGRRQRSTYTLTGCLTPRETWGSKPTKTPREKTPHKTETPQLPKTYPPAGAPVVLRTKRGKDRGTTSAAAASASAGSIGLFSAPAAPPPPAAINAQHVVGAWVDAMRATGVEPVTRQIGQVAREGRELLEAGNEPQFVLGLARSAGGKRRATLVNEMAAQQASNAYARPTTDDKRAAVGSIVDRVLNRPAV